MLKGYIKILHTNLAIELEKYRNLPFYLAVPYVRSKEKAYATFRKDDILTYVITKDKGYYSIVNPNSLEPYGPFTFCDSYYGYRAESSFRVYDSDFYIGTKYYKPSYLKKYVYARNENLRRIVGNLASAYSKTEEGIPNYLVYLYLNFFRGNQIYVTKPPHDYEALLRFDKQKKLLKIKENLNIGKKYFLLENNIIISMYDQSRVWQDAKYRLPDEELWSRVCFDPYPYIRYTEAEDGTIIRTTISGGLPS